MIKRRKMIFKTTPQIREEGEEEIVFL